MASLVLGAVGAVVGFYFGGPAGAAIGWSLGSAVGGLLDPPKSQGPRLSDLKIQGSSYGSFIGIPYGTIRMAGDVIDQTDLKEHSHTEGGKGGPEVTSFTYTVSFMVQICEGPILGVFKIWGDGRLIYSVDETGAINGDIPVTFYLGTETQLPDPTFEAVHGVGNIPAYRGTALAVLTDWDVGDFGNRIPTLTFEVSTEAGDIPWRVNTFTPASRLGAGTLAGAAFDDQGILTVGVYNGGVDSSDYYVNSYDLTGAFIAQDDNSGVPNVGGGGTGITFLPAANNSQIAVGVAQASGTTGVSAWYYDGHIASTPIVGGGAAGDYYAVTRSPFYSDGFIYGTGGLSPNCYVAKWDATDYRPGGAQIASYTLGSLNVANVTVDDDGNVWVGGSDVGATLRYLWKFDSDLNLITAYAVNTLPSDFAGTYQFTVFNGYIAWLGVGPSSVTGCQVYSINADETFTFAGFIPVVSNGPLISLGDGRMLGPDGVLSLNPPPAAILLSQVVEDISGRAGLPSNKVNVAALTDVVEGYLIGSQMSGRAAIETLMPIYFFDAVESDNIVKFVKRGGEPVATIDVDELAAMSETGGDPPPPFETVRGADAELPAIVTIVYLNPDADYQNSTQSQRRQTGGSRSPVTLEVPVVLNDSKAKQVVDALTFHPWLERNRRSFKTTRKYLALEPTDVVKVAGLELRITQKNEGADGVIKFDALPALSSIFSQPSVPGTSSGFVPPVVARSQGTQLELLDIPLVKDDDLEGFYVAMAGEVSPSWRGAALFKSSDGGATYTQIARSTTPDVMGTCSNTLGDFLGGDIFDEINSLTVVIGPGGGTLTGSNELGVLNGANKALSGNEIIQYRDATLIDVDTYILTGLLRGRRGTEWAIGTHGPDERFIVLPTSINIASTELNVARLYKAVTIGRTLASAPAVSFSNSGSAVRPYSVVQVGGGFDGAGNCTVNWTRRTRIGGDWVGYGDVPLSEESELYTVEIWNSTFTTISATFSGLTAPTLTFVASGPVYGKIYQNGRFLPSRGVRFHLPNNTVTWTSDLEPTPGPIPVVPIAGLREIPLNWSASGTQQAYSRDYGGFGPADAIAVSFTTPAGSSSDNGFIGMVEFDSPPTPRIAVLSTVSGDFDVGLVGQPASKQGEGNGPRFYFTVGVTVAGFIRLNSSTTYYMNLRNGVTNAENCDIQITLKKPSGL